MAQVRGGISQGLSGMAGGVVFVLRDGKTHIRSAPQRSKNSWSPRQLMHRNRFRAVAEYCKKYKYTLIPQIWNLAAEHKYGYNLFLKANMPAFGLDGQFIEFEKLRFSAGKLPLPRQFKAKRSIGDAPKVEVTWLNDENMARVNNYDELMMVVGYPDHSTAPIATGVKRSMCEALIDLPADNELSTGIYLFFAAYDRKSYSPDQYFGI